MPALVADACAASIESQGASYPVDVVWHAGEPTTTPLGHFRALLASFESLRAAGKVRHGIQTNGTLIDQRWCDLFIEYGFEVGISIDGPPWANRDRLDWAGRDSFSRTRRGIGHLHDARIPFTVICVVTPTTIGHADELVDFFAGIGCQSVGFNIEEEEGAGRPAGDESAAYTFWRRLVERREHDSPLAIRDLDQLLEHVAATRAGQTRQRPFDPIPTVAYNGDTVLLSPELLGIHSDVYDDFVAGNVLRTSISNMIANAKRLRYVTEFSEALQTCAADCEFYAFCGGAQAGNRYFEHGTFAVAETVYCRNTRQALVRATVDHITERTSA